MQPAVNDSVTLRRLETHRELVPPQKPVLKMRGAIEVFEGESRAADFTDPSATLEGEVAATQQRFERDQSGSSRAIHDTVFILCCGGSTESSATNAMAR